MEWVSPLEPFWIGPATVVVFAPMLSVRVVAVPVEPGLIGAGQIGAVRRDTGVSGA